jgi:hypothetical protein
MRDPRAARLAEIVARHCARLQPGETVLFEAFDASAGLMLDPIEAIQA